MSNEDDEMMAAAALWAGGSGDVSDSDGGSESLPSSPASAEAETPSAKPTPQSSNKKAKKALQRYITSDISVIQQPFLFQTQKSNRFNTNALTQLVKRIYERVGIVGASSHSGRRTFITRLATSGVSVRVIAEAVGHSSIATTQRYIDINDELVSNAVELV